MSTAGRGPLLILSAKAARCFCLGVLGVFFPIRLSEYGLDARGIGLAVAAALLASAAMTFGAKTPARRWGPRAVLAALAVLMGLAAVPFAYAAGPAAFVLAAMAGNLALGTAEGGPFSALEQVLLVRSAERSLVTRLLSLYNLAGFGAAAAGAALAGRLAASPALLAAMIGAAAAAQAAAYLSLPPSPLVSRPASGRTDGWVRRVAALFALDAFAGGFIVQAFILYWFHLRFGLELSALGWIVAGTQLLSGLSFLFAEAASRRLGLVNAMVFTHLASSLLLVGVALAPSAAAAVALLWMRHLLSQIDVPTRQAFLMTAVADEDREAAATLANTSRTLAQALGPGLAGWAMQAAAVSAPLFIGAGLKIAYDLMLYSVARRRGG